MLFSDTKRLPNYLRISTSEFKNPAEHEEGCLLAITLIGLNKLVPLPTMCMWVYQLAIFGPLEYSKYYVNILETIYSYLHG